jgi:hypothetical protein
VINVLELPVPPFEESIRRIEAFARDLAYGAIAGLWGAQFKVINLGTRESWYPVNDPEASNRLETHCEGKWQSVIPLSSLLVSFDYLTYNAPMIKNDNYCLLTQKAFALLEKPSKPPSVFISYKQSESSALALLIESRLKNVDPNISIFIDKNIETGESINSRIKETLEISRFFICLLSASTLVESSAVKEEIALVKNNTDCVVIPICHSGYRPDKIYSEYFGDRKAVVINYPESAEEYETNMTKLLIRLGYSTI